MQKLRDEQEQYMEFQKLERDISHLTCIHISYTYLQRVKALEKCEESIENANKFIADSHTEIENNVKTAEDIETECAEMQQRIDAETGGELKHLEEQLAVQSKEEATAKGAKKSAMSEVDREKRQLKQMEKNLKSDEDALQKKEGKMATVGDLFESLKAADETDTAAYDEAQKRFQAISAGLDVNEDGQATSLQEQLIGKRNFG